MKVKTKDLTMIAMSAALICIAGPVTVAIGPVPLSPATFAIYMAGAVLGSRKGTAAAGLYLLIGFLGVPVFSGFTGGFQKLAGPTGGYLLGYLPCAWITGIGAGSLSGRKGAWRLPVCMTAGTVILYLAGTAWFMIQTGNSAGASLSLCVLPFLPGDAVKITLAVLLTRPVRRALALQSGGRSRG